MDRAVRAASHQPGDFGAGGEDRVVGDRRPIGSGDVRSGAVRSDQYAYRRRDAPLGAVRKMGMGKG